MDKRVTMNLKELKRMQMLQQIEAGQMTAGQAAEILGVSLRHTRRLIARYREQGAEGLVHGNRGRPAHNRITEAVRAKIEELAEGKYRDYNDSHFTEELEDEWPELQVSRSTVRRIRRSRGIGSPRKRRSPRHRRRRERKAQVGMLLQTDGSRHDWLEGRGPWLTLIAYIDDASNEVSGAVFREEEDAAGYFMGLQSICRRKGIPAAIYADRHTIFQSPAEASLEQQLADEEPLSQFGRLLDELGIELIEAHSPQAKGRIERLWGTLQDRLVKALREANASNIEEANQVLVKFLSKHNRRFMVEPAQSGSAYVPWPKEYRQGTFFCFKHQRTVTNDNTIAFDAQRLQIPPGPKRRSYAKARVDVWQLLDGRLEIRYQGKRLAIFKPANQAPVRIGHFSPLPDPQSQPEKPPKEKFDQPAQARKPHKPASDHPWRRYPAATKVR
jgi:transposase